MDPWTLSPTTKDTSINPLAPNAERSSSLSIPKSSYTISWTFSPLFERASKKEKVFDPESNNHIDDAVPNIPKNRRKIIAAVVFTIILMIIIILIAVGGSSITKSESSMNSESKVNRIEKNETDVFKNPDGQQQLNVEAAPNAPVVSGTGLTKIGSAANFISIPSPTSRQNSFVTDVLTKTASHGQPTHTQKSENKVPHQPSPTDAVRKDKQPANPKHVQPVWSGNPKRPWRAIDGNTFIQQKDANHRNCELERNKCMDAANACPIKALVRSSQAKCSTEYDACVK